MILGSVAKLLLRRYVVQPLLKRWDGEMAHATMAHAIMAHVIMAHFTIKWHNGALTYLIRSHLKDGFHVPFKSSPLLSGARLACLGPPEVALDRQG
jgi:hypothetical protein